MLMDAGADLEARDSHGAAPLRFAQDSRHEATARVLLERGARQVGRVNAPPLQPYTEIPSIALLARLQGHAKRLHGHVSMRLSGALGGAATSGRRNRWGGGARLLTSCADAELKIIWQKAGEGAITEASLDRALRAEFVDTEEVEPISVMFDLGDLTNNGRRPPTFKDFQQVVAHHRTAENVSMVH